VSKSKIVLLLIGASVLAACSKGAPPSPSPTSAATPATYTSPVAPTSVHATLYTDGNGWEPVIATDPSAPYIYAATTLKDEPCIKSDTCPHWNISFRRSDDGGATWGEPSWICPCKDLKWLFDPQLRSDGNGNLYAAFLVGPGYDVLFTRSSDHGDTWSKPVSLMPVEAPWIDHPWLTVSADGKDVYVGYSKQRENWITASHDSGRTWAKPVPLPQNDDDYYYYQSGTISPDGTAYFLTPLWSGKGEVKTVQIVRSTNRG